MALGYKYRIMSQQTHLTLEYALEKEDFLSFQLFVASQSKTIKKRRNLNLFIPIPIFLFLGIAMYGRSQNISTIVTCVIFSVLWLILYPLYVKRLYKKNFSKYIQENYAKRFGNLAKLIFYEEGVGIVDKNTESKLKYDELESIIEVPNHIFLALKSGQSIIIPKNKIAKDLQEKSISFIENKIHTKIIKYPNWTWK